MSDLAALAATLQVSERTLRRAAGRGMIRCRRSGERRLELPIREQLYLESHWSVLNTLVSELRTLPNVRLAVLFGSVARGDDSERSDIDIFVRLGDRRLGARAHVIGRLEAATGREIQLVEGDDANLLLLAALLREGRVLVDRDEEWAELLTREPQIAAAAAAERASLEREVLGALSDLLEEAGVS